MNRDAVAALRRHRETARGFRHGRCQAASLADAGEAGSGAMEFSLIDRIRRRAAGRADVLLGIGDDAALVQVPPGHDLVTCVDTLVSGVHFPPGTAACDIGWKALAVNLSDLAAMGADPAWCLLAITLPTPDMDWLDGFIDGWSALAQQHDVALVGGDTTRGPLALSVCAQGHLPHASALRRDGARIGDEVWVTGTLGDAAAALQAWRHSTDADPFLRTRLDRPTPRVAAGRALRGLATACIDVSDGLLADLAHVLRASGVGARIDADALPLSAALRRCGARDACRGWALVGGDDYELCFTAPAERRVDVEARMAAVNTPVARIGVIEAGAALRVIDARGAAVDPGLPGWDHFAGAGA